MDLEVMNTVFLAFDIERALRRTPAWLSILFSLGLVLVSAGIIYLYNYVRHFRDFSAAKIKDKETSQEKMAHLQEKMLGRQNKLAAKRADILKEIPTGPVDAASLQPAAVQIRNRVVNIPLDAELAIGKLPDNDLPIVELGISRRHAKIRPERGGYMLYDLASSNGTFVNGKRITKTALRNGDVIKIGPESLVFKIVK